MGMPKKHTIKKVHLCKCPKCEREYKLTFAWFGRGIPRKFCSECRGTNNYRQDRI